MYADWFDKAEAEIEESLSNGEISNKVFQEEMRNLRAELRGLAEEAAEQAYNDTMGYW